jgi:hypothetical protein
MSYIIKNSSPFVSIKLTQIGREQLAQGQLNFTSWAIGDSELNYNREEIVDANQSDPSLSGSSRILRPFDRQPNFKSYITPLGATTPFQPINASNLNVVKAVVNNQAEERGFFTRAGSTATTIVTNTFIELSEMVNNSNIIGSTIALSGYSSVNVGDILLLKLANNISGSIVPNENLRALPNLWYKIQSIGVGTVTLDRPVPKVSGMSATSQVIVYRGGEVYETIATGTTTAYWDSGTLQFNSNDNVTCHDVPVWNMNNVWCEDLAGITGLTTTNLWEDYTKFGSYDYLGTKNPYLEYFCLTTASTLSFNCNGPGYSYPDDISKSISIIHFTNNSISSLYGEYLYIDTTNNKVVKIYLPDLMYHRANYVTGSGTTQGMNFVSTGNTQFIGTSDIEYLDLIEDPTMIASGKTPLAIGKVFPQLKLIVIHDDEIVAALSYKSNRNWTLPALAAQIVSPSGGTSTGILDIDETIYLTYSLEMSAATGLVSSMPCQDYIKLTNNSSGPKDIAFRIDGTDFLSYMRKIENAGYDGLGFYATNFKLMYQKVVDPSTRPDPALWSSYDFTSTAITGTIGTTIDPKLLENQIPTTNGFILDLIKDSGSTIFNLIPLLNMAPNSSPENLQFGDERLFYGNVGTYIGATIYKTIFDFRVNSGQFNATTNPTRSTDPSTNPPDIKVSEVGVYDNLNNLVCIGKLSKPVALTAGQTIMLELSIDF